LFKIVQDRTLDMKQNLSRRDLLQAAKAAAAGASLEAASRLAMGASPGIPSQGRQDAGATRGTLRIQKGILVDMLPKNLGYAERFKMARDAGFEVLQAPTTPNPAEAEEMAKAADETGIRIDSVMNMNHWQYPLSSSDPAAIAKGLEGMRTSLHNAHLWGAGAVLLVPAVVNPQTSYRQAWVRSQKQIRTLIPLAAKLNVVIAIEEVWNKFLLSPVEMATYVDEFKSPWVQVWFDVGNVVLYGYPQDWIRTLRGRINRLHLKDFKLEQNSFHWENLGDGQIDWAAVHDALTDVGFHSSAICELPGGDEAYLRDLSKRVDRLVLENGG
jgi:L-ribulose-5-phosphate 3-epimerase